MKTMKKSRIVLAVLAVFSAAVLFVTYGTVLPAAPFATVPLEMPTVVDSNGEFTCVIDAESQRALILNADGDLTGVASCTTADSPVDAFTDVCISDGRIFLAGVRFAPDSDDVVCERVAVYDKGGNYQGIAYEASGNGETPDIKALCSAPEGVAIAHEFVTNPDDADKLPTSELAFDLIGGAEIQRVKTAKLGDIEVHDAALSVGENGELRYATLSVRGVLEDGETNYDSQAFAGHVFTAIDIGGGVLYACDDETGALYAIDQKSKALNVFVDGTGYHSVHANGGTVSLCNSETGKVTLCDATGAITSEFTEVRPSIGFSARMVLVWICGLFLAALVLTLAIRKVYRLVKEGNTEGVGPMFLAVAVVAAIAVAVGSLSSASYQKMIELRANEINTFADYLESYAAELTEPMETVRDRDALRTSDEELVGRADALFQAVRPSLLLVYSAKQNDIGVYYTLYGKDDKGIYYLYGSTDEYVIGSAARNTADSGLQAAFERFTPGEGKMIKGNTLRDTAQYRLVQIPTADGEGVLGVVAIGSKVRSFESSIVGDLAQRILALLVMVLVVYLAYSELRACGRCLFMFRERQEKDGARAAALLTRPLTLAITMLTSIDSVMTVLIARDLLLKMELDAASPLLALPAVMLGIGMVAGQGLYAIAGSRVGLRKLMACGALVMLLCACFTAAAVASGVFWLYCVSKFVMAVPFGMLYTLGYSLPRIAADDKTRAIAAGGVRRTDTSAAALGTVLGGYAADALGDVWVYALVAVACLPVILMALNLLPRGMRPLEKLAQSDQTDGRIVDFLKTAPALAIALFVVLPAMVAMGYASFLFPLYASDLGLSKANVNSIYVLGQLVVYVLIGRVDRVEGRYGRWKATMASIALLGVTFLLFAVNTTLAWSVAVIAIVAVLCKFSEGWKILWLKAAGEAGVPAGRAVAAQFSTRSLALVAQPFILGALLGPTDSIAVIVIGVICAACAVLFWLATRRTSLAKQG